MGIQPMSVLIGLGAAWALPVVARLLRPVIVQVAVVGMGIADEARRVVAEQAEVMEDIFAEAKARRDELAAESNGHVGDEEGAEETVPAERHRRRATAAGRRRA
jgi:hypothetical protein